MLAVLAQLAKPGIVFGNLIAAAGGYLLAARGAVEPQGFAAAMAGTAMVVGSGCAFNNVIDRDIDARMERTRRRALVTGRATPGLALAWGTLLGVAGFAALALGTNAWAVGLAAMGWLVYVGLYSLWLKRRSPHAIWVGSLAGAAPPAIGYCAAAGRFDGGAALLFLIYALWQIPHSDAIAIFRLKDFAAAGLPVSPLAHGMAAAKRQIVVTVFAFTFAAVALAAGGWAGWAYGGVALAAGGYWCAIALARAAGETDAEWARRIFVCSIVTIMALGVMMSVDFGPAARAG